VLFLLRWTRRFVRQIRGRGIIGSLAQLYQFLRRKTYAVLLGLPFIRDKVQLQVAEAKLGIEKKLVPSGPNVTRHLRLPSQGWDPDKVRLELAKLADLDHVRWEDGMVSGAVYHGGEQLAQLQTEAFSKFIFTNPIHPDVFPGVRKMEAEVVAMVLSLFNAPDGGAGVTTSGGTESILMACLGARQKALVERRVTHPEMLALFPTPYLLLTDGT